MLFQWLPSCSVSLCLISNLFALGSSPRNLCGLKQRSKRRNTRMMLILIVGKKERERKEGDKTRIMKQWSEWAVLPLTCLAGCPLWIRFWARLLHMNSDCAWHKGQSYCYHCYQKYDCWKGPYREMKSWRVPQDQNVCGMRTFVRWYFTYVRRVLWWFRQKVHN